MHLLTRTPFDRAVEAIGADKGFKNLLTELRKEFVPRAEFELVQLELQELKRERLREEIRREKTETLHCSVSSPKCHAPQKLSSVVRCQQCVPRRDVFYESGSLKEANVVMCDQDNHRLCPPEQLRFLHDSASHKTFPQLTKFFQTVSDVKSHTVMYDSTYRTSTSPEPTLFWTYCCSKCLKKRIDLVYEYDNEFYECLSYAFEEHIDMPGKSILKWNEFWKGYLLFKGLVTC
jgi:hypothetical protein